MDPALPSREALTAEVASLRARLARMEGSDLGYPRPIAPELIGREVSCRAFSTLFEALAREGQPREILTHGTGVPAEVFTSPRERVSWSAFLKMMANAERHWTPDAIEAITFAVGDAPLLRAVFVVGRLLYSVTDFYLWAFGKDGPASQLVASEDLRAEQVAPGRLRLEMRMRPGYPPSHINFLAARGSLRGIATAFGYGPAHVVYEPLPDGAVFHVQVPEAGGRLDWIRRSMGWVLAARSAGTELREARDDLHRRYLELRREVDARNAAEEARRAAQMDRDEMLVQMQMILTAMPLGCLVFDEAGRLTYANRAAEGLFGPLAPLFGTRPDDLFAEGAPRAAFTDAFDRLFRGDPVVPAVLDNRGAEGKPLRCEWHHTLLARPDGDPAGIVSICEDVTDRERSAAQLLQAQKMEGIGRLAGGIAHDFNNLLSVVMGYASLLEDEPDQSDRVRAALAQIQRACQRGANLASQLLAFGRRQMLDPKVLDLDDVVQSTAHMLRPLLGADLDVRVVRSSALGRVRADPTGLEQVIVNLAVNARDAMPDGGRLTFETRNVDLDEAYAATLADARPGPHVLLSVSDSGMGMDAATRANAFEPFFTTKPVGKGTGLGLSTVYGIVRQSGGHVAIYSEPGHGTTFHVYLPRVDAPVDPHDALPLGTASGGHEAILVVEDDEALRKLALQVLSARGYRVLVAAHPAEAIEMLTVPDEPVDLLLTDVVMPGMTGVELARRAHALRPDLRVLFTSGYAHGGLSHSGGLDPHVDFLAKPFTPGTLSARVRAALDR